MEITTVKLDKLKPYEKNVRRHSDVQINEYKRSLKKYGQVRPMVVTDDFEILIGNGMYKAMQEMGMKTAEVLIKKGLSDKEKIKLMLADNKIYELGTNDNEALEGLVKELENDFDIPGYDDEILKLISSTSADIDKDIQTYGEFEDIGDAVYDDKKESEKNYGSTQGGMYSSVERDNETGEILNKPETGRYVICPKCGEKIWL